MIQCKFNLPLLLTVVSGWITPLTSYVTHFSDLEIFVRFWKTTRLFFFSGSDNTTHRIPPLYARDHVPDVQRRHLVKWCWLSLFFQCFLSTLEVWKALGWSLVLLFPAAVFLKLQRVLLEGDLRQSRMGSLSHTPLIQTGPFSLLVGGKSERSQVALWRNPFHPGEPVLGRVTLLKSQARARRWATSCRIAQGMDNPCFSGEDSKCFSSPGVDLGWATHLAPVGRISTMVAGCGNKMWGPSAMTGESSAEPKSGSCFHGTSALWNKMVQWMGKKKRRKNPTPQPLQICELTRRVVQLFMKLLAATTNDNLSCSSKKHHDSGSH